MNRRWRGRVPTPEVGGASAGGRSLGAVGEQVELAGIGVNQHSMDGDALGKEGVVADHVDGGFHTGGGGFEGGAEFRAGLNTVDGLASLRALIRRFFFVAEPAPITELVPAP